MDVTIPTISQFAAAALTAVPLLAIVGAALAQRSVPRGPAPGWSIAGRVAAVALATAVLALVLVVSGRLAGSPLSGNAYVRVDTAGAVMLTLVAFVGWVIVRYSRRYLAGDRGEARLRARAAGDHRRRRRRGRHQPPRRARPRVARHQPRAAPPPHLLRRAPRGTHRGPQEVHREPGS